ncbi:50S ribosomal protein L27 [Candidatus Kaiserbacteria bacterium RIFCSPHIGHO2_02_FULL_50_50]|uniref:Large ribosomal subunit protein bL27 n=1 Tax=Candidatus Kaiserbacteria bacterium RIFCSPHIGHO2_02_FULL_50_50 TaxID=1798492 RepID=A0A1F6DE07_9BACT|nr:MAG: 50S ribosomal protein L27 [Candidatus Kaiserbacteria bacterium RIFCSPHIGHO2_02_FULL_50_50]OGG89200.1 MAG: 50S ribosomal protein L27 [Candidatus Kaiserbacteria bacterium RIFCSPLOWO2_12_FULL_50_10]
MATKKAGGSSKNGRDSQPNYLGLKRADGQIVGVGEVLVRQRGTKMAAGKNVGVGHDHTLFAMTAGKLAFRTGRKTGFDGNTVSKKFVDVLPTAA